MRGVHGRTWREANVAGLAYVTRLGALPVARSVRVASAVGAWLSARHGGFRLVVQKFKDNYSN